MLTPIPTFPLPGGRGRSGGLYSLVIRFHEEPHLAREFGDDYAAYVAQTGRWLPRLRRR